MTNLEELILEELLYESVRASVDIDKLLRFDRDLKASIEKTLESLSSSYEERQALAMDYLLRVPIRTPLPGGGLPKKMLALQSAGV